MSSPDPPRSSPDTSRVGLRAEAGGDSELAAIYEQVTQAAGAVPHLYQALGAAPPLLRGWIGFAWSLRGDAGTSRAVRELVILRTACLLGSDYVWRSHARMAVRAGASEAQVASVASWSSAGDVYDALTRAALTLTDELAGAGAVAGVVSNETWTRAAALFSERELVEIVLTVSWYQHVARVVAALAIPLEEYHARVPPVPEKVT